MTLEQLKKSAQNRFATYGFDGTSLAHIAEDVGIKKQSIYTYFKGKDELFLQVFSDASANEWDSTREFIERSQSLPIAEFLHGFLLHHKERFERNTDTKFWLRISFFPPAHLYDEVMEKVYTYLDSLEKTLEPVIKKAAQEAQLDPEIDAEQATIAFLGVLDSVFVEMLYGGPERLEKRLSASWHFYWRGISRD